MEIQTQDEQEAVVSHSRHSWWMVSYLLMALACLAAWFLLRYHVFDVLGASRQFLQRLALAGFIIFLVFMVARAIEKSLARRSPSRRAHYNLVRLLRLLSVMLALFILVTFLFEKWYTAVVSLGLVSLI